MDRAEVSTIKVTLLNYFKYCLSRSTLYELNPNLLTDQTLEAETKEQVLFYFKFKTKIKIKKFPD